MVDPTEIEFAGQARISDPISIGCKSEIGFTFKANPMSMSLLTSKASFSAGGLNCRRLI